MRHPLVTRCWAKRGSTPGSARGRNNVAKRYLVHIAAHNLGLGQPRQSKVGRRPRGAGNDQGAHRCILVVVALSPASSGRLRHRHHHARRSTFISGLLGERFAASLSRQGGAESPAAAAPRSPAGRSALPAQAEDRAQIATQIDRLYGTFHAAVPFLRWPLDHLFHDEAFTLSALRRLGRFGSDHCPILVELVLEPAATAVEVPRPARGDREALRRIRGAVPAARLRRLRDALARRRRRR